jgi:hypothetical protein
LAALRFWLPCLAPPLDRAALEILCPKAFGLPDQRRRVPWGWPSALAENLYL